MTKTEIINHIMQTPHNTNRAVLRGLLGDGNWETLYNYIKQTPYNMNRKVLESLINLESNKALVDFAKVGIVKAG